MGIIACIYFRLSITASFYIVAAVLLLFLFASLLAKIRYTKQWLNGLVIYVLLILLGIFYTHTIHSYPYPGGDNNKLLFVARIIDAPSQKEKTFSANAEVEAVFIEEEWMYSGEKINMYFEYSEKTENILLGDVLICSGRMNKIKNFGNPGEFNYKRYMAHNGVFRQVYLRKEAWKQIDSNKLNPLLLLSEKIRKYWLATYKHCGIEDDRLSVLTAMTLGMKESLGDGIKASYADSGALHVLAVSGLHVGIIYLFFGYLLSFLKKFKWGKPVRGAILLLIVWFYALITGFPVSIFRAATMFSFIIVGESLKRKANTFNSIFVSAFVILLVNPYTITNVGFQLSYMAVIGIVFFQPRLYALFQFNNWLADKVYQLVTVSVSAQLGVLPITLFYFHQFANYFLFINIIIIPFAFIVVFMGVSVLMLSFFDPLAKGVAVILDHVVAAMNKIVSIAGAMPFAVSDRLYVNLIEVLVIYLIIIFITWFFIFRKHKYLLLTLFSTIVFIMLNIQHTINAKKTQKFYVYNCKEGTLINCINGKKNILISGHDVIKEKEHIVGWFQKNWMALGTGKPLWFGCSEEFDVGEAMFVKRICSGNHVIQFVKKRYLVMYDNNIYDQNLLSGEKLYIDKIIVANNIFPDIEKLKHLFKFNGIVIDSSNSYYTIKKWQEACEKNKIELHVVSLQGAYSKAII